MSEAVSEHDARAERELAIIADVVDGVHADAVGVEDCRDLRARVASGRFPHEVAADDDARWSESTIRQHAYGHCQHDGPAADPPTTAAATGGSMKVTTADCQAMRARSQRGDPEDAIADALGVSRTTAHRHIRGSCIEHAEGDGS